MASRIPPLVERPAWAALQAHQKRAASMHLRKLFADDPKRGERLTLEAAGIYLDYSKNRGAPNEPQPRPAAAWPD
jgi:glucose-6-phosphate isomerase